VTSLLVAMLLGQTYGTGYCPAGQCVTSIPRNGPITCGACSGGGGGGGAPTTAQYWTGAADATLSAEKNLGALGTGLVLNTAGTPSVYAGSACATGAYAHTLGATGGVSCSTPAGSVPGGSNLEVQFNSAGSFGGDYGLTYNPTNQGLILLGSLSSPYYFGNDIWVNGVVNSAGKEGLRLSSATGTNAPAGIVGFYAEGAYKSRINNDGSFSGNASTATALSTTGAAGTFWANNNTWQTPAGGGSSTWADAEIPSGLINGSNTAYTLAASPSPSTSLALYANGVRLRPTTDYSITGSAITMVAALQTGDWFYADYRSASVGNNVDAEIPSGTINGSNTAFTVVNAPNPSTSIRIYVNGVRLRPTTDYTISGTSLTMVWVPQTGDWLYADYRY
jgi:hypothetical protein